MYRLKNFTVSLFEFYAKEDFSALIMQRQFTLQNHHCKMVDCNLEIKLF